MREEVEKAAAARGRRGVAPRRAAAVAAGKLSAAASRRVKRGGTALPGLVASRVDPDVVRELTEQLSEGAVVITGTNGKTTTARMLGSIVADAGFKPLRNAAGSNLMRGLASSLVLRANALGNLSRDGRTLGLFEVDEAALPEVLPSVRPTTMVLLNLFRDQLDRYGEVATVARLWLEGIARLPSVQLVANADDPLVADVALSAERPALFFGVESAEREAEVPDHASDVKACPRCGGRIRYTAVYLGHLGHYSCQDCPLTRPEPSLMASNVRLHGITGSALTLRSGEAAEQLALPLPGLYNVYNALAAAAVGTALHIPLRSISRSLSATTPAFGRMERLELDGRGVVLALAKNPVGLNQTLRTLAQGSQPLHLLAMLNDNAADGRDVSWIWDADVEMLEGRVASVVFSGRRAEDLALRFKYAGVIPGSAAGPEIVHDTEAAFKEALALTPEGETLSIVPTYTALLDVRATLTRLGHVRPYWEE